MCRGLNLDPSTSCERGFVILLKLIWSTLRKQISQISELWLFHISEWNNWHQFLSDTVIYKISYSNSGLNLRTFIRVILFTSFISWVTSKRNKYTNQDEFRELRKFELRQTWASTKVETAVPNIEPKKLWLMFSKLSTPESWSSALWTDPCPLIPSHLTPE